MDLSFGPEYDDFRSDVVNFLNNNSDKAPKGGDLRGEQAKDWQKLRSFCQSLACSPLRSPPFGALSELLFKKLTTSERKSSYSGPNDKSIDLSLSLNLSRLDDPQKRNLGSIFSSPVEQSTLY